jgi:hypothetical protein
MTKLLLTLTAALGLTISAYAGSFDRTYFHYQGRSYWISNSLIQQAVYDGTSLADYDIRNNIVDTLSANLIGNRAVQMAGPTGYDAIVWYYTITMAHAVRNELNRCGYYYPVRDY